ncbi:hypothetical protein ABT263_31155 [Kitasatospora sp. NPDC001603]|uniref:hypothetical protein n=1 Tax=Kitasatospora sp. NPDC001603 TaxID=3154388 RepID=UPI00332E3643
MRRPAEQPTRGAGERVRHAVPGPGRVEGAGRTTADGTGRIAAGPPAPGFRDSRGFRDSSGRPG